MFVDWLFFGPMPTSCTGSTCGSLVYTPSSLVPSREYAVPTTLLLPMSWVSACVHGWYEGGVGGDGGRADEMGLMCLVQLVLRHGHGGSGSRSGSGGDSERGDVGGGGGGGGSGGGGRVRPALTITGQTQYTSSVGPGA